MEKQQSCDSHSGTAEMATPAIRDVNVRSLANGPGDFVAGKGGQDLERGLKSRHIQFIALGGAIGTGLFVGSGLILSTLGPAPLFMGYLCMMALVWNIMNNLAEMTTYLPMKGISVPYFVERFVEPSLAFACGWNYWYAYAMLVGAEASAGAILFEYWDTPVPTAVWIAIILIVTLGLNIFGVAIFGEAEFWFASIKFITIMGLILVSLVIMCGGAPNDKAIGFSYWNNPGAFREYLVPGNAGKFLAFWSAFARAGFAFITSPELIAVAAGETVAPRRNIPKAARRFVYRLAVFYGLGSLMIGCIVPWTNPDLLNPESNANSSPWVIGIKLAKIKVLDHIINTAILTSAWSAGNAFLYSGSRVMYSLALNGQAPAFCARTDKRGVPYVAVIVTWAIGLLAFLNVNSNAATVFNWFMNISTISGFIAWIVVMITFLRWRKAMVFHGMMDRRPFKTPLQPYATYFVLFLLTVLTLTNGFHIFFPQNWNVSDFLAAYITIPIFLVLYVGHKIVYRTPFARKIEDIDVITGVKEMEELDDAEPERVARNVWEKIWFWIA
ncbi:probable proline-specific permease (proline transport protein) [Cephalotrichum gorgonifer]|uniref:Probable proline-specific permease (Proline transport protein) n=1 Tax=Cephalotrichum gorgonifer TaxID=2041049 RepID=A0AAE8SSZ3_9PEZI|nr:probable proline-specific permease (proline transport protein) [Cephalotrichum gorgonifer]